MKIKEISVIALFCAINIILSLLNIMLPFSPVAFSLSICGVFLGAALLTPKQAVLSQILYIMLGLAGLPVFSGFRGGFGVLAGPTGGYILAYPIMAFFISFLNKKIKGPNFIKLFILTVLSLVICYIMGSVWLSFVMKISFIKGVLLGAVPFAAFDIIKALFCTVLAVYLKKILVKTKLLEG